MPDAGKGLQDGVGWLLGHPDWLFVQVPSQGGASSQWLNLSDSMSGGRLGWRNWGYTVGMLAGREPIGVPGITPPTWEMVSQAQRAKNHSFFLGSLAVLGTFFWLGFRRIPDTWATIPEERVAYWPGPQAADEKGPAPPKIGEGGGE